MVTRLVFVPALGALVGGLLLAPSTPVPGPTSHPTTCQAVPYHANLAAVGTIRPATPGSVPSGACSQITLTAWRNNYDYNCNEPRTPHETTTATGPDLEHCSYSLPIEMGHMVAIKATTTIPFRRVTLTYNDSSEAGPFIWEEKNPVTINWLLKGKIMGPAPKLTPRRK